MFIHGSRKFEMERRKEVLMFPNLDAEMARHRVSQGTLATAIGVTPSTMSLKLKGKAPITLSEAVKIRDTIDKELSLEYLFETEVDG